MRIFHSSSRPTHGWFGCAPPDSPDGARTSRVGSSDVSAWGHQPASKVYEEYPEGRGGDVVLVSILHEEPDPPAMNRSRGDPKRRHPSTRSGRAMPAEAGEREEEGTMQGGGRGRGGCTVTGTSGRDVLRGTTDRIVICGLGGNDRLLGKGGSDILKAGSGANVLRGREGERPAARTGREGPVRRRCERRSLHLPRSIALRERRRVSSSGNYPSCAVPRPADT